MKKYLIHSFKKDITEQKRSFRDNIFLDCNFTKLLSDKKSIYNINLKDLYSELDIIKGKILTATSHKKVFYYLKNFFNKNYPNLKFSYKSSDSGYRYKVFIAGSYCPLDYEIVITYLVDKLYANKPIKMNVRKWNKLKFDLCEVISHELVHYCQHINSNNDFFKSERHDFDSYIKNPDVLHECNYITEEIELEAFAHTVVIEQARYSKSVTYERILEVLQILEHYNVEKEVLLKILDVFAASMKFWRKVYGIPTGFAEQAK